jgi:chromosome segregation ATPase
MLEEISNDIIEEEKEKATEENAPKMSDELGTYSLEEYMNSLNEETEEVEETVEEVPEFEPILEEEVAEEPVVEEIAEEVIAEEALEETEDEGDEALEILPEVEEIEEEPIVEEVVETVEEKEDESKKIIEDLKAQLAYLNKQLEAARSGKTEVVTINMTEEECVARLNMLEERLKDVKKDYKNNMKEYRPLKKVMNDLEKYQTKLRRKDTIVAKKKVALYGVNNYVDIDKEKAEKLANDLELLEGLRLSVSHCEEVINANKDRYPILERTNQILEDQIAHIEADIASTQATLNKIREQNGEGENE